MKSCLAYALITFVGLSQARAQQALTAPDNRVEDLQKRVQQLESEVSELRQLVKQLQPGSAVVDSPAVAGASAVSLAPDPSAPQAAPQSAPQAPQAVASSVSPEDRKILDYLHGTTINVGLDMYYEYNFNYPVGRVNLLRAYDVLGNEFSLNQASVVMEHAPDVASGRRWGGRLDLQFGQATDTLQGNPSNEPRPDIYRNVFQAYGTYVAPLGKGLNIDFGKWGSSLGIEGNYTKDQMNYSRSYWFDFLPFYHMGARVTLPLNDRFGVNYWLVNGTNQVEATNGYKDELFGFTAKPVKSVTWTMNYYLGQEHPDRAVATNCGPIPVQPGLCFTAITPAPNGHTDIFDTYATWQATPKLVLEIEGDYFIQRLWRNAAPGQSSAPMHVDGGAAYLQYQLSPKFAIATRAEYMSDRQGLFSGISQALKENTVTFDYKVADGFLMRYEWRRDYSNQPTFLTSVQGVLSKDQNTATLGLIWFWGRKEGAW
jgi:Putative beta-barrel porin-2, OmpL-like. bbp2